MRRWEIDRVPLLDREEEIAYSRADPEAVPLAECEPAFNGVHGSRGRESVWCDGKDSDDYDDSDNDSGDDYDDGVVVMVVMVVMGGGGGGEEERKGEERWRWRRRKRRACSSATLQLPLFFFFLPFKEPQLALPRIDSRQSTGTRSTDRIAASRLVSNTAVDQIWLRVLCLCTVLFLLPYPFPAACDHPPIQKERKRIGCPRLAPGVLKVA